MNVDQCLFGYEDGHRLLASSLPLGDALSLLTELSDLAPGTHFGESGGYWTGLPVASLGRYVLMRTWPAPEMSRPGCVWTHALLIDPKILGTIKDLSVLQSAVLKPGKPADKVQYRIPLNIQTVDTAGAVERQDEEVIGALLSTLYGELRSSVEIRLPGELDLALFTIWSQQWPRLRRNFRFQTAASRSLKTYSTIRFDVLAKLSSPDRYRTKSHTHNQEWIIAAVKDAECQRGGELRSFLWHYGQDVRRQRGSFRPLTEMHLLHNREPEDVAVRVFHIVRHAFPEIHDALSLKQDLVDGRLVPGAQVGLIQAMIEDELRTESVFPLPTPEGLERLAALWPIHPEAIIGLLNSTLTGREPLSGMLQSSLLSIVQTDFFWRLSQIFPALQALMVSRHPEFLVASEPLLEDMQLTKLIELLPARVQGLDTFVGALASRDSSALADAVYDRFGDEAAALVMTRLSVVSTSWKQRLLERPCLWLQDTVLGQVTHSRLLYELAEYSGWLTPNVLKAGVSPWFHGLVHAKNDLNDEEMETLGCFMMILACHSGGEEGLRSVELFFNTIHRRLIHSTLSERAAKLLYPLLPDIGRFRNWDLSERLRIIIAEAFIKHSWAPERYLSLISGRKGRSLLIQTIAEMPGGQAYTDPYSEE